jgi:uncharacterized protein (TIGR02145 family)
MKPKIQPKKRQVFIAKMIPFTLFIFSTTLIFNSCQKEDVIPVQGVNHLKSAALADDDGYSTYYQNELFIRETGKPVIAKRTIGSTKINDYEGCLRLHVQSGLDGEDFVSSAVVKIDGKTVLSNSDFNNSYQSFQIDLCSLTETSVMEVEIVGTPGSTLDIWIDGKPSYSGPSGSFVDCRDGNSYKWVRIGNQIWMAENLRATKFNDGTPIPLVTDGETWVNLSSPAYCWYNNDLTNYGITYGAMYNWYAVNTGKLSPCGWHVPTQEEWENLINFLGGYGEAGAELKEGGFAALLGGYRYDKVMDGVTFLNCGYSGHWWGTTEAYLLCAFTLSVYNNGPYMNRGYSDKNFGFSIRCIKD